MIIISNAVSATVPCADYNVTPGHLFQERPVVVTGLYGQLRRLFRQD